MCDYRSVVEAHRACSGAASIGYIISPMGNFKPASQIRYTQGSRSRSVACLSFKEQIQLSLEVGPAPMLGLGIIGTLSKPSKTKNANTAKILHPIWLPLIKDML